MAFFIHSSTRAKGSISISIVLFKILYADNVPTWPQPYLI